MSVGVSRTPDGATVRNKVTILGVNRHIQYTLVLMCAKNHVNIFSSFLDIRQNVEWPHFFGPPWTVWVRKIPPEVLWTFFQNIWELFDQILHVYYEFLSTLDCEFLFHYLQLWRSYAILSVTTKFPSCAQNVHHWPKRTLAFSDIFPKRLGIFSPNLTCLLSVHISTLESNFLSNYLQLQRSYAILRATTQRAFRLMVDILSTLWWSRLIWHNFVKVVDNWIKICSPAYIGTCNRRVKFGIKIPTHLGKMSKNFRGDFF